MKFMDSLVQKNNLHLEWTELFIVERIEPQFRLACEKSTISKMDVLVFERLY